MIDDILWCNFLNIKQIYGNFPINFMDTIPQYDNPAFKSQPNYHFVYDKLFITQSQNIPSGKLNELNTNDLSIEYPIFIKPRWGHTSAGSKDCYKINNKKDLQRYITKPNMMWSTFINANEGMTDFIMKDGKILYQLTMNIRQNSMFLQMIGNI